MILIVNIAITVIAFLLYTGLLIVVITSTPQTDLKREFRWYLFSMVIWSLSAFFVYTDQTRAVFWFKMMTCGGYGVMIGIFRFSRKTVNLRGRLDDIVPIFGLVMIGMTLFTNLAVPGVSIDEGVIHYDITLFLVLLAGPGYMLILLSLASLIQSYSRSPDPVYRNRLIYLILGIIAIIVGSSMNFTPLGRYPIDIAANGITALLIMYAILRYQLLDIRVVIRQGLVYSVPTIIIGATYFLFITLALNIFNIYSGVEVFLLSLAVAVITALIAEPLRDRAQQIIDRMFFREKYDSWSMLQNLSGRVATVLDLYKITSLILDEVTSTLHIIKAAFLLIDEDTGRFQLTEQIGLEEAQHITFRAGHPLVLRLTTHNGAVSEQDISVLPHFRSMWKSERQDLEALDCELFIPIKVQSQLVGIFAVGSRRSEQPYSEEDKLTLSAVANQTAVAIENARLFTSEQNRRKEIDTLYDLSRQLVATDDLETVLKSVARHAVESIEVTYSRVLTRENDGSYTCRAIYPERNLIDPLRLGKTEPIIAEYFYNWVIQQGKTVILRVNNPEFHEEEKQALFLNHAGTICICPLIGADEVIGILILGEFHVVHGGPFSATGIRLVNAIATHSTTAIQRTVLHERLEENFLQTVVSLANAMDARDSYTRDHSQRMADIATKIGKAMKLSSNDIEALHWAAILHDIGKIGVPDEILNKKGPLTKKEWIIMKEHPIIGAQIVEPVKYLEAVSPIIRAHHERYDGTGYPYGLESEDIPLTSRILAVVDAYVAIRDERIYSKAHTHEEAVAELRRASGTQFDPRVVDVFCKIISD